MMLVIGNPQHSSDVDRIFPGNQRRDQHDKVRLDLDIRTRERVGSSDDHLPVVLEHPRYPSSQILDAVVFLGLPNEFLVALARGSDVHVEGVRLTVRYVLLE